MKEKYKGNDWFTVEQIDDSTYAISEYKHWEETHCYLLCGENSAVLIDTGLGVADIRKIVDPLTKLPVMVLTTHVHWDHIGGHGQFEKFAVHEAEQTWISEKFPLPLEAVKQNLLCKPCDFPEEFKINNYKIFMRKPDHVLKNKDKINLGNRELIVLHTPGHSPGHCCFYEPERKYLYSGDLVYQGCLDAYYPTTDPAAFFESVKKIAKLDLKKILPGHHSLNVSNDLIPRIVEAFASLKENGKLKQGAGMFDFGTFQVHL